jgi:hypothetical protein
MLAIIGHPDLFATNGQWLEWEYVRYTISA